VFELGRVGVPAVNFFKNVLASGAFLFRTLINPWPACQAFAHRLWLQLVQHQTELVAFAMFADLPLGVLTGFCSFLTFDSQAGGRPLRLPRP
jgi:hypothetical protein